MCLSISCLSGAEISRKTLLSGFVSNNSSRSGSGFAYAKDGQLFTEKGFFVFSDFYEAYRKTIGYPSLLHFRMASSGPTNFENCHPFSVSDDLVIIHNGILNNPPFGSPYSDTYLFNEKLLKPLLGKDKTLIRHKSVQALIAYFIGEYNKLSFLDNEGVISLVNGHTGNWQGDNWFSNCGYEFHEVGKSDTITESNMAELVERSFEEDYKPASSREVLGFSSTYMNRSKKSLNRTLLLEEANNILCGRSQAEVEHDTKVTEELRAQGVEDCGI